MKSAKLPAFLIAAACTLLSCKKPSEGGGGPDCENNHTTTMTYTNTGTIPLRVEVATTLTAQFEPIAPVVTLDLAPGQSVIKEIQADEYFTVWSRDCPANCKMIAYYRKTYTQCSSASESRGI